jgi:hypothetical protein
MPVSPSNVPSVDLRELDELSSEFISALVDDYPFDDFRRLQRVASRDSLACLAEEIGASSRKQGTVRLAAFDRGDSRPAGLLLLQNLPYDTELFGLPMAGIPYFLIRADHPAPREVRAQLLDRLEALVVREGYVHVSARVDSADLHGYQELTEAKFRLMETLVSMTYDTERRGAGVIDPGEYGFDGIVREVEAKDREQLCELAGRSFTLNRYHLDEHLPGRNAGVMMSQWIRNYCEDPVDHQVWVAEGAGGKIDGFLGHALNRTLERHSGVLVSGRALLAVENQRSGVGLMLSRAHTWQSRGDYKEADTQLNNYGMIKVSFNLSMDMVRTKYSFHRWFGN